VRDHHQHRARDSDEVQGGDAQEDEAHVGDAGVAHQAVEVLLAHGHPAAIEEVAQAQPGEDRHPVARRIRQQRQRDADQAVEAELLEHAGMEHGGGGGGGAVARRRPGVERPERDQDAEPEQQQREDEALGSGRQGMSAEMRGQLRDVERARARLHVERDQPHQGEERAEAQVERDLEGGVVLLLAAAPDADHDERRHQRQLMEEVEAEEIERGKGAENAAGHDQQQEVELFFALPDFPGDAGRGEGHERPHQDQADVDAIHADVVAEAQAAHPRHLLLKLVAGGGGVKAKEHFHRQHRRHQRGQDGDAADHRPEGARHQQQHDGGAERPAQDVGQRRHF